MTKMLKGIKDKLPAQHCFAGCDLLLLCSLDSHAQTTGEELSHIQSFLSLQAPLSWPWQCLGWQSPEEEISRQVDSQVTLVILMGLHEGQMPTEIVGFSPEVCRGGLLFSSCDGQREGLAAGSTWVGNGERNAKGHSPQEAMRCCWEKASRRPPPEPMLSIFLINTSYCLGSLKLPTI